MDRSTAVRIGIAGLVAGAGLTAGGVAMASAGSDDGQRPPATSARPGVPHADRGLGAGALAKALGLDADDVAKALREVRRELRPEKSEKGRRTPPTDEERSKRQDELISALAKKLGVPESKIEAALESLQKQAKDHRQDRRADARKALEARLDAAVEDGTLTEADRASVLKAYDAGLIGGGFGGPFGGGFGKGHGGPRPLGGSQA